MKNKDTSSRKRLPFKQKLPQSLLILVVVMNDAHQPPFLPDPVEQLAFW